MRLKAITEEDFVNYKKPALFLGTCTCDWKCCSEIGEDKSMCQNSPLAQARIKEFDNDLLFNIYINNPITESVVLGGLEPMLQFEEIYDLIKCFREQKCNDDFVIYTGYYKDEIKDKINKLKDFENIIIKFGRFIPNNQKHYDNILGIELISDNQYAEKIS